MVTQATAKFQNLSRLILDLQSRAESDECRDKTLANLIKKVQMFEEKKLHLTVDLQLALQQSQDNPDDELVLRLAVLEFSCGHRTIFLYFMLQKNLESNNV